TFIYLQAIINYRKAIRINDPVLKRASKRAFSPIWSARRHPIYRLIEVADEIQLMRLHSEIREVVEKNCVISRSGIYNQHQGLDAIIEEINKTLKALIPPIPQDRHWKIAARNCKKFFEGQELDQSQLQNVRFCALLRGFNFVNSVNSRTICRSLGEECELDKNLKNFTNFAKLARKNFIIETFIDKNNTSQFRVIPITKQEAKVQENEKNMTKNSILLKIDTLLEQLGE
ncbi:5703_t:CDS:2, partial [Scutellospora calospora]